MLRSLPYIFWTSVVGVGFCLVMSIHVAMVRKENAVQTRTTPQNIPVPAEIPHQ